ncbi:MAG: hypothetical protein E7548_06125 [Ruminococcaceae bacterium]|nr:hypothetical protein [Oscillospiraceae bacterium]
MLSICIATGCRASGFSSSFTGAYFISVSSKRGEEGAEKGAGAVKAAGAAKGAGAGVGSGVYAGAGCRESSLKKSAFFISSTLLSMVFLFSSYITAE